MSVLALVSAHGAPGVTTSALAMVCAWPLARPGRRVLLVDADPAGSGLLTGYLHGGVPPTAGVSVLAAARPPFTPEQVIGCAVGLDAAGTRMVLPGVSDPVQARPLAELWAGLADSARDLSARGVDVLVDAGRVGHRHEPAPWWEQVDLLAVVARGDLSSVAPAAAAVRALSPARGNRSAPVGLVVDPAGYTPAEVGAALGVSAVLTLPRDPWAAQALAEGGGRGFRFDRSPLIRSARAVVERITQLVPDPQPVTS